MFAKWQAALQCVTVEPMILVYFLTVAMSQTAGLNLLLQKACHPNMQPTGVDIECWDEAAAQSIVTKINTWKPILQNLVPVLFVIFAGAWSDSHGRRRVPLMLLPIIGQLITDAAIILNIYFWEWPPEVTAVFECIFYGITGGKACLIIGIVSYISDITTRSERTARLGVVTAIFFIGTPIGVGLSGYLRSLIGFYGVFTTSMILDIIALQLGILLVKNPPNMDLTSKKPALEGLFNPREVIRAAKTIFKKRDNYDRFILCSMIIVSTLTTCPANGEYSVLLFYVRYKFQWNEVTYGVYVLYKMVIILIGTAFAMGILNRWLKVRDSIIGIAACCTLVIAATGNAFASSPWDLYFYPAIDMMHGAGVAVAKSIASKVVQGTELGQLNSVMAVSENVIVLGIYPLYNFVYRKTFQTFTGAFFLLSAGMGILPVILFCYVFWIEISSNNIIGKDEKVKENTENKNDEEKKSNDEKKEHTSQA
ncbi:putative peptidoglycan muropeptide transporter SLC46 [Lycorma delicatula]|uniref:putative peptidoglycan muropeptide transporter SLC46 n=1 Tax=Lycorma delicatula TaxID=130591 RepID=UPI003F516DC6